MVSVCLCGVQRSMLFSMRLQLFAGTYACDFSETRALKRMGGETSACLLCDA